MRAAVLLAVLAFLASGCVYSTTDRATELANATPSAPPTAVLEPTPASSPADGSTDNQTDTPNPPQEPGWVEVIDVAASLNIRSGPGTQNGVVAQADLGTILPTTGERARAGGARWLEVGLEDDEVGWVHSEFVQQVPEPTPTPLSTPTPLATPTPSTASGDLIVDAPLGLRLRSEPSTGGDVIKTIEDGATVSPTGQSAEGGGGRRWVEIRTGGDTGWVVLEFLRAP